MTQRVRPSNQPSQLLKRDENEILIQLAGPKCVVLACGVAQVMLAEPPSYSQWSKIHVGVVTFIKDNEKKGYFIRLYDIDVRMLLWEQELYNLFVHNVLSSTFHSFATNDCPAGLNFASEKEADLFNKQVQEYLMKRMKRRNDRTASQTQTPPSQTKPAPYNNGPMMINKPTPIVSRVNGDLKKSKKKNKKGKIDKKDIGNPSNFQHVNHVGWDANKGLDMINLDPKMKQLFNQVGLTDENLKDENTASFVYSFIEQHGGLEAVKNQPSIPVAPPVRPPSIVPPPPSLPSGPSRPNLPKPPVPPVQGPPPPPPPQRNPPQQVSSQTAFPSGGCAPPPPPPPPPPMPTPSPSQPSSLLDQIRKGRDLNPVDVEEASVPADGRDALLSNIRDGFQLRPVAKTDKSPKEEVAIPDDSLAGALMKALHDRAAALNPGSSDEEGGDNDGEEEEEWDD